MSIKLTLQKLSGWIEESAKVAEGAVTVTVKSGLLKDTLGDLCKIGGVAGALFKLGAMTIPDPTAEQRIVAKLHRTFLTSLDKELVKHPKLIAKKAWKEYTHTRLPEVAVARLSGSFTWLSVFGSRGRKPGRNWPIVGELSDVARTWVVEAAAGDSGSSESLQRTADIIRGRIHEALCKDIDELLTDPEIRKAFDAAQPRLTREALQLLAAELSTLARYRLFGEVPQDVLYLDPTIKTVDFLEKGAELDWSKVAPVEGGDQCLYDAIGKVHPRLVVIVGEMGVGKSCLMRVLAARLADHFLDDDVRPPVYARWRDIYDKTDVVQAIAEQIDGSFGLPLHDLADHEDLVYLIDGFDEMQSHQEGYLLQCFERLVSLVNAHRCTVVVAMRSTVITDGLKLAWKHKRALIIQVQEFDDRDVDTWAEKWRGFTGQADVTGERLRNLCASRDDEKSNVAHNPLLLYMLAKHVHPEARERTRGLSRTEVFRIFVDQTIRGKVEAAGEDFPIPLKEQNYRMLLQEMAYIASWPEHAPKCPVREVKKRVKDLKEQNFEDLRTAFVLHFFQPGDVGENEFEFQPEGFRHYLLAEWCVRTQLEALRDDRRPSHSLARNRDEAMTALAQFPLREVEREILNEIYEDLGRLAREPGESLVRRLQNFGVVSNSDTSKAMIDALYDRLRYEAETPTASSLKDERVGIPQGQEIPPGLDPLRLLVNYWDQCLMATLGLYRGLAKDRQQDRIFEKNRSALYSYFRCRDAVRGHYWDADLNLSFLNFQGIRLSIIQLFDSNLSNINLSVADLIGANLSGADLRGADLSGADLRGADLSGADLRGADLSVADLRGADLRGAIIEDCEFDSAIMTQNQLDGTVGKPRRLPQGIRHRKGRHEKGRGQES